MRRRGHDPHYGVVLQRCQNHGEATAELPRWNWFARDMGLVPVYAVYVWQERGIGWCVKMCRADGTPMPAVILATVQDMPQPRESAENEGER